MGSKEPFYLEAMALNPEVTGSCHLDYIKFPDGRNLHFVVDCGLFQEREYSELNKTLPFEPQNIDFALVTHNHVDHIGRLPLMVKGGFRGDIIASIDTCKLMPLALADSQKVLRDTSKKRGEKLLYNEVDVLKTETLLTPISYYETKTINDNLKVTFLKNGHLAGAALILVQINYPGYGEINTLFTGDYNNKNTFFDVPPIPKWIRNLPLTVIVESTYGYMESNCMKPVFWNNVLNCINNGGSVIALVYSLGRAQEMLYETKCMQDCGVLNREIKIGLDGKLAIKYTDLYRNGKLDIKPEMTNFIPDNFFYINKSNRQEVLESTERKIIFTTSGMGSYGPAQTYIPRYISKDNTLIHFTGYTAEDTLGYRLKSAKYGDDVLVGGLMAEKRASVEYTTEYSAHAKADELIALLKQFKDLKLVLVNHGETEVKEQFAKRIFKEVQPKNVGILGGDYSFRINPYGLAKVLPSKFK